MGQVRSTGESEIYLPPTTASRRDDGRPRGRSGTGSGGPSGEGGVRKSDIGPSAPFPGRCTVLSRSAERRGGSGLVRRIDPGPAVSATGRSPRSRDHSGYGMGVSSKSYSAVGTAWTNGSPPAAWATSGVPRTGAGPSGRGQGAAPGAGVRPRLHRPVPRRGPDDGLAAQSRHRAGLRLRRGQPAQRQPGRLPGHGVRRGEPLSRRIEAAGGSRWPRPCRSWRRRPRP